jgi:hypothetical protein
VPDILPDILPRKYEAIESRKDRGMHPREGVPDILPRKYEAIESRKDRGMHPEDCESGSTSGRRRSGVNLNGATA